MSNGKKYTAEQIIVKLREVEVLCGRGMTVAESVRQIGVTEQIYYRWRKEYGNMDIQQAKRLKELEKENERLKKLVLSMVTLSKEKVAKENDRPGEGIHF